MYGQEDLLGDYAEFETYLALKDYQSAARIVCEYLVISCNNPQRFEPYHKESIAFLLKQLPNNWTFLVFRGFLNDLIASCELGVLRDFRIRGQ